jgi:hypothetical protein
MSSSVLQVPPHLCVEWGNQLGRGQGLDNGNTAWLEAPCQFTYPTFFAPAHGNSLSVVRGCGHPLDSCPRMQSGMCLGPRRETRQVPVFYQVVCLSSHQCGSSKFKASLSHSYSTNAPRRRRPLKPIRAAG